MFQIDILMATYNGGRYVAQQIRSLQNQTYANWTLWVHDDGSTDDTIPILCRMALSDERIHIVQDEVRLHDPAWNFMYLLRLSRADYAIFCDQDDLWLENKLQVLMDAMLEKDQDVPQAVYGNGYMYYAEKGEISGKALLSTPQSLGETLFANGGVQGCAILMNRKLREICLNTPSVLCMHDHLVTLAALTFGELTYVDSPLMLYRRHGEAVTDVRLGTFREKVITFFKEKKPVLDRKHVEAIRAFVDHYGNLIPEEKMRLYQCFFKLENQFKVNAFYTILAHPFFLYGSKWILLSKLLFRPLI